MEIINSFKKYLKNTVPYMVFKSVKEAEANETSESRVAGDEYLSASLQMDSFLTYSSYSVSVLNQAGITDIDLINKINTDVNNIPSNKRDAVLIAKRKEIISNYEELNNYYRMLIGYPDLGAEFIYLPPALLETFGYRKDSQYDYETGNTDNLTPLHLLPQNVLTAMDKAGLLDTIYESYNSSMYNAEYVRHCGSRKVDIISARTAGHFELIYIPRPEGSVRFIRDFTLYYEEARGYFMENVYNYHYSSEFPYYEEYMGFFILNMTIQRMITSLFEVMVERDFYDVETCRMFLEAYSVPFIDIFTLTQQKNLVKNLNILLMNKCTSQVLYDLLNIMDYDTFDITKYLLVKQHKTDRADDESEPKPIFVYKTVLDENGNPSYEVDKSKIYDYYFVGVDMNEKDIKLEEINNASSKKYSDLTEDDALWIEDEELIDKLQESEINFTETKYCSISVTLRMQKIMFEHVYLQKMLCDKSLETSNIMVEIPLITATPISLFEMEIILICLRCKHDDISPDLLTSPSSILSVLGFNFDADLELIKSEILSRPDLYSKKLVNYIKNVYFIDTDDVSEMYANVRGLADLLIEGMQTTTSEKVYHAYKKLYLTLMVTDIHNEVFNLPDGSTPETYMDWLKAYDFSIYDYIDKLSPDACIDKINYIATKMTSMFTSTNYLKYLNPIDETVIDGILKILRWFKSYTIDIRSLDIIYLFDSRYYNLMRMITRIYLHANITIRDTEYTLYEWINAIHAKINLHDESGKLRDFMYAMSKLTEKDLEHIMSDAVVRVKDCNMTLRDEFLNKYADQVLCNVLHWKISDNMHMRDTIKIIH